MCGRVRRIQLLQLKLLQDLLADEESKNVFRQYNKAGICIFIGWNYSVFKGDVWINAEDGVKKTAKWLATGKI